MSLTILLRSGDAATLLSSDGHQARISSPKPAPPGSLVAGKLDGVATEFQLKVRNCYRDGDRFVVEGRTQNATRELKAALIGAPS